MGILGNIIDFRNIRYSSHVKSTLISFLFTSLQFPLKLGLTLSVYILLTILGFQSNSCKNSFQNYENQLFYIYWTITIARLIIILFSPIIPIVRLISNINKIFQSLWLGISFVYHCFEFFLFVFYVACGFNFYYFVKCGSSQAIFILFCIDFCFILLFDTLKWSIVWFINCLEMDYKISLVWKKGTDKDEFIYGLHTNKHLLQSDLNKERNSFKNLEKLNQNENADHLTNQKRNTVLNATELNQNILNDSLQTQIMNIPVESSTIQTNGDVQIDQMNSSSLNLESMEDKTDDSPIADELNLSHIEALP